jgi:hypothetical protein
MSITVVLFLIVIKEAPPTPPSAASEKKNYGSTWVSLKTILANPNYRFMLCTFTFITGS